MLETISNIFSSIMDYANNIKDFLVGYFDLLIDIINFFPSPFKEILLSILTIIAIVLVVKVVALIK